MEQRQYNIKVFLTSKGISGSILEETVQLGAEFASTIKRNLKVAAGVALFYVNRRRGNYILIKEIAEKLQIPEHPLLKAINTVKKKVTLPNPNTFAKYGVLDKLFSEYNMLSDREEVRTKACFHIELLNETKPEVAAATAFMAALYDFGEIPDFDEVKRLTRAPRLAVTLALRNLKSHKRLPALCANKISVHEIAFSRVTSLLAGHTPVSLEIPDLKILEAERELLDKALIQGCEMVRLDAMQSSKLD